MKPVPFWGSTNIRRHRQKWNRHDYWHPGFVQPPGWVPWNWYCSLDVVSKLCLYSCCNRNLLWTERMQSLLRRSLHNPHTCLSVIGPSWSWLSVRSPKQTSEPWDGKRERWSKSHDRKYRPPQAKQNLQYPSNCECSGDSSERTQQRLEAKTYNSLSKNSSFEIFLISIRGFRSLY